MKMTIKYSQLDVSMKKELRDGRYRIIKEIALDMIEDGRRMLKKDETTNQVIKSDLTCG